MTAVLETRFGFLPRYNLLLCCGELMFYFNFQNLIYYPDLLVRFVTLYVSNRKSTATLGANR